MPMFSKRTLAFFYILFFLCFSLEAQDYFQQETHYTIHVQLDDTLNILKGDEVILYANHSPDTLHEIWFLLYPNGYSNKNTAMADQMKKLNQPEVIYLPQEARGSMTGINFMINDSSAISGSDPENPDICLLHLNNPLLPGDIIKISTPFTVKIPEASLSRMGHDGQAYYITQWFPKPAVYDRNGWHPYPYLDQGEFYYEYGSYDVFITLPENYVVAATGRLVDNEKEEKWIGYKVKQTETINWYKNRDMDFPPSSEVLKTLHYRQDSVHDFAWFADKRFHICQNFVTLPNSGRKVNCRVYFTNAEGYLWKDATQYVSDAVYYYSQWVGDYPYDYCSAMQGVEASGGMEYPMITLIGPSGNSSMLEEVIMHEVGHNWFQGVIGSNERKNAWMDEGINSFYEMRYLMTKYPDYKLYQWINTGYGMARFLDADKVPQRELYQLAWEILEHRHSDMSSDLSADVYPAFNYNCDVYAKSASSFHALYDYLGSEKFDSIMQKYYVNWQFRHPQPGDLKKLFTESTNKNLDWFFDGYLKNGKTDYAFVQSVKKQDSLIVTVKNKGDVAAPVSISLFNKDSLVKKILFDGFLGKKQFGLARKDLDKAVIDADNVTLDAYRKNNSIKSHGILRRAEPLRIQMFGSLDNPAKTQLFFCPAVGWNKYDHFQAGIILYNTFLYPKKIEFVLMPLYAIGSKTITGGARLNLNFWPSRKNVHELSFRATVNHYSYSDDLGFFKATAGINLIFRPKNPMAWTRQSITYRFVQVIRDNLEYFPTFEGWVAEINTQKYYVNEIKYTVSNKRKPAPYSAIAVLQQGDHMLKAWTEGKVRIPYNARKGLDVRMFFGGFIWNNPGSDVDFRFRLSGFSGYQDPLYDHVFAGRSESKGLWSQQYADGDGGFRFSTPLGQTWDWLWAINLETPLPGRLPIRIYFDAGTYSNIMSIPGSTEAILYDAGIKISVINNIFDISFPLIVSKDIQKVSDLYSKQYWQNVRFTFHLEKVDPWEIINNFGL
jgi:hypothetical protein